MGYLNTLLKNIFRGTSEGDGTGTGARDAGKILNDNKDLIDGALEEINNASEKSANKAQDLLNPNSANYPSTQAVSNAVSGIQAAAESSTDSKLLAYQKTDEKGQADGYASLDSNAKVPAAQMYAVMDEIIEGEYIDATTFNDEFGSPVTPGTAKLYQDTTSGNPTSGKQYRWSGSQFSNIPASPGTTDEVPEGSTNKYFTAARVRAVVLTGYSVVTGFAVSATDTILAAIGKLQGQINSLGTLLGNKLDKAGYTGTAQDLKNLIDTKQTALQVQTLIDQNESTALDKRMALLAADLDTAEKDAIKTKLGIVEGGGSAPQPDYLTKADLLANQGSQVTGEEYTMLNANGWNDPEQEAITHSNWATVKYLGTTNGDESDYDLREQFDVDVPGTGSGITNENRGAFTGELDFSDGNLGYYDPYDGSPLGRLTLSATKVSGTTAEVDIPGGKIQDINNFFPVETVDFQIRKSGAALVTDPAKINELTFMYRTDALKIVNRVFDNINYTAPLTPASLTNAEMWYDGTDSSTMTLTGSTIDSITDKIKGKVLNKSASPEFITDHIHCVGLEFLNNVHNINLLPGKEFHGFLIFKMNTTGNNPIIQNTATSSSRFSIGVRNGELGITAYNGTHNKKSTPFSDTTNYHKIEFKLISGVLTYILDGTAITGGTTEPDSLPSDEFRLGNGASTGDSDIKDFFFKTGEMTTQERNDMLQYITDKHGI